MGLQSDYWVGLAKETTFGTFATPTVFLFGTGKLALDQTMVDGKGYRHSFRGPDTSRHAITRRKVAGSITDMDAVIPAGLKTLLEAAFGTVATTVVDAPNTQNHYLFTPSTADFLPSYTIQQATPRLGSSTVDVATFTGCQCASLKISVKAGELVGIETSWVGKDQDFGQTAAVPSWPASPDQLGFADGKIYWNPTTATAPTSAALSAPTGTALAGVRDFEITIKNALDDNGQTLGSGLTVGRAAALSGGQADLVSGKFTREYLDRTLLDDAIAQTERKLVVTFTGRGASSTAPNALQLFLGQSRLSKPFSVEPNGGDVITQGHEFTGYQTSSAAAVYAVLRTTE